MNNKDLLLIITMGILLLCPVIGCFGEREGLAFYKSNKWDDIRNKGRRFYGNGESSNRPPSYFEEKKHLDMELKDAYMIRDFGDLDRSERGRINRDINRLKESRNRNEVEHACKTMMDFCMENSSQKNFIRWKKEHDIANYATLLK